MGDAQNIVVAQMARVFLAPVGTVAPADPVSVMPAGWREVGLFTPDSLGWSTDPSFEEVRSHQSNFPTRRFQTEDAASAEVDLQEWTGENFKSVYGGGTITEVPGPPVHYRYSPPAVGGRTEVAACIEIIDGSKHYRRIIPRCEQSEGVEQSFERTSESTLPLRLSVLGSDLGDPWYDLTDDPAFEPEPPVLSAINPDTGPAVGGTEVTLTGTNLTGTTDVDFGADPATEVAVVSDSEVTCTTPAVAAGAVDVVLTTAHGSDTLTDGYTYV